MAAQPLRLFQFLWIPLLRNGSADQPGSLMLLGITVASVATSRQKRSPARTSSASVRGHAVVYLLHRDVKRTRKGALRRRRSCATAEIAAYRTRTRREECPEDAQGTRADRCDATQHRQRNEAVWIPASRCRAIAHAISRAVPSCANMYVLTAQGVCPRVWEARARVGRVL